MSKLCIPNACVKHMWMIASVLGLLCFTEASLAANEVAQAQLESLINNKLTDKAREIISRHLSQEDFQVFVKSTTGRGMSLNVPYLPPVLSPSVLELKTLDEIVALTQAIKIDVMIAKDFDSDSRRSLESLLRRGLNILDTNKLQINFVDLVVPARAKAAEQKGEEKSAKADQALDHVNQGLKGEIDKLKVERSTLWQKLTNAEQELKNASQKIWELQEGLKFENLLRKNAVLIVALITGFLAILVLVFAGLAAAKRFALPFNEIANALREMGGNMFSGKESEGGSKDQNITAKFEQGQSAAALPSMSMETLFSQLLNLQNELNALIDESNENIVIKQIVMLIENKRMEQAVATMELLGKERANDLYQKMSQENQAMIYKFLQEGSYERPKAIVMLESGDLLKTKLNTHGFNFIEDKINTQVERALLRLNDAEISNLMPVLDDDLLQRLLLYLEPKKIGGLLTEVKKKDPSVFIRLVNNLPEMSSVELRKDLDEKLLAYLAQQQEQASNNKFRNYLRFYHRIIDTLDEDLEDEVVSILSNANDTLASYLRDHFVNFRSLFKLNGAQIEDIISNLTNKQIATLFLQMEQTEVDLVNASISERRREMVRDEMELLKAQPATKQAEDFRNIRRQIVKILRNLQTKNLLEFSTGEQQDQQAA